MKVYAIVGRGSFGGGLAVVAAHSREAAKKTASAIRDETWGTDYGNGEVTLLPGVTSDRSIPSVLTHYETGD